MPRAPKGCHHPGCRNLQPCKLHTTTMKWRTAKSVLPGNWKSLVRAVKARDRSICQKCRKLAPNGEVDHKINRARGGRDELSNLQWMCKPCHRIKTIWESAYGKRAGN